MSHLKAGFARIDITPPFGVTVAGYYEIRLVDGIRDPLYATAVAFDNGDTKAIVMSLDILGLNQIGQKAAKKVITARTGIPEEAIFIACTHTHLGPDCNKPGENDAYVQMLYSKLADAAQIALADVVPATMLYTRGKVEDVAFVRRFRMKNGEVRTNPGCQNPEIDHALGTPDENSSLLILKREGKPEIGIVNYQVHPDVIGGCALSADYPKFVRDTYEKLIDNSLCMYLNGAQGDTNHVDVRLGADKCRRGYDRARYMGRKIAMSVIANYELAEALDGDRIVCSGKKISVKFNKGKPEEIEEAKRIYQIYQETNDVTVAVPNETGMRCVELVAQARRIVTLMDYPEEKELYITALAVGDVVFTGFPGEPFTDVGRAVKASSPFALTITACCANGYEGYFPTRAAFEEGGYEALTARYVTGTAEKIVETSIELMDELIKV